MRKKFALNLAILIGANLLVKPFWILGIDRVVQNSLGASEYGLYFAIFNYSLLFNVLLDLGLNYFNNRAISRSRKRITEYFSNLFILKIALALIYFLVTLIVAFSNGFSAEKMKLLAWLLLNQSLLTLILFFRSNLQALQLFKTDSLLSITDRLLSIVFCAAIIWWGVFELSIMSFILAQTVALLFTCILAGLLVLKHAGFTFHFWSNRFKKKIFHSTFPYALLGLLMVVYSRIDAVLLDNLLGEKGAFQAGVYAASYRLFDAANQFGFLFGTILLPLFAANFKQGKKNESLVHFSMQSIMVFAVSVAVLCVVWAKFILQLLYHQSGAEWVQVFTFTMLAFIPASLIYITGTLLAAKGEIYTLCKVSLAGVLLNFTANYFSIPHYGAVGSAATALATNILVCTLHFAAVIQKTDVRFSMRFFLKITAFMLLSFVVCFVLSQFNQNTYFLLATGGVAIVILALILNVLPVSAFKDILRILNTRIIKRSDGN